jgi:hypothetical protein
MALMAARNTTRTNTDTIADGVRTKDGVGTKDNVRTKDGVRNTVQTNNSL